VTVTLVQSHMASMGGNDGFEVHERFDPLSPVERSHRMSLIHGKDSGIEMTLRKRLFSLGYRYRLHYKKIIGRPDMAFPSRKKVIFVNGCFWHGHTCDIYRFPKTNIPFWRDKIDKNVARDSIVRGTIAMLGWKYYDVWECQFREIETLIKSVVQFLEEHDE
jgi:DNA mismatch endonuclease, patch repair protein